MKNQLYSEALHTDPHVSIVVTQEVNCFACWLLADDELIAGAKSTTLLKWEMFDKCGLIRWAVVEARKTEDVQIALALAKNLKAAIGL